MTGASLAPRAMLDVDWDLVFRYFGGECTPAERDRFERWLAADPQRRVVVDAAVTAAGRALDTLPVGASARFQRAFAPTRRGGRPGWLLPIAASLVIAVGGTILMKYQGAIASRASQASSALRVAQTVRGGRQELRLADGTRVVLGPASTLRYPAEFGAGAREVELVGEGYFEVTHDAAHPFRVRAAHASAEDIGTAFGVRAYPEDSVVRVVVAEGSVALGAAATAGAARRTPLTPGQLGSLARGEALPTVRQVNVAAHLGWLEGRLTFDETPLADVVAQLGRWYDAPFRIADPALASRTLTASFTTEPLAEVLAALAPVLDVRFDRVGDTVVVRAARR